MGSTPVVTIESREVAERQAAEEMLRCVAARRERGERCLLGLATGGTMVGVYRALIALVRERGASFAHVATVNLDEYLGLDGSHPESFRAFMETHLFGPLAQEAGFDPQSAVVPDGVRAAREPVLVARELEAHIRRLGGIDLQLLGIGRNGHLAFNEPGASHKSRTRVVALARATREDAAAAFGGVANAPRRALTLGLGTILEARRLRVLAFGAAKAPAVASVFRGPIDRAHPASALRRHGDVRLWLDDAAAAGLPPDLRAARPVAPDEGHSRS